MKARTWIGIIAVVIILISSFGFFIVGLGLYLSTEDESLFDKGDVALIKVEGQIFDADPLVRQIDKIARDDKIKAVVVRINSPGGTMGGAQEIYAELKKLREKKPVIASLGTIGTSGGYYVALGARKILANPGTITGSIGVLLEYVNAEDLVGWLKLKPETLKSGKYKDIGSPIRPMTEEERAFLQKTLASLHEQFKKAIVAERSLDPKKLEAIADGRILTGEEALSLGLIDELGTLQDAVNKVAQMAGIKGEPEIVYPRKERTTLIDLLMESAADHFMRQLKSYLMTPRYWTESQ